MLHWNDKQNQLKGHRLYKDTIMGMYKNEGPSAFYRGMSIQLFLSFYAVIQMIVYEKLSKYAGITDKRTDGVVIPDKATFFVGGTSRTVASFVFYPLNVVRTRIQKQRFTGEEAEKFKSSANIDTKGTVQKDVYYTTIRETASNIWKNEGIRGFYKGCLPSLMRIFPNSGLFFLLYETTHHLLDKI